MAWEASPLPGRPLWLPVPICSFPLPNHPVPLTCLGRVICFRENRPLWMHGTTSVPGPLSVPWPELCPHLCHCLNWAQPCRGLPPCHLEPFLFPLLYCQRPICSIISVVAAKRWEESQAAVSQPLLGNSPTFPRTWARGLRVGTSGLFSQSLLLCHHRSPPSGKGSSHHQLPWAAEPPRLTCTTAPSLPRLRGWAHFSAMPMESPSSSLDPLGRFPPPQSLPFSTHHPYEAQSGDERT